MPPDVATARYRLRMSPNQPKTTPRQIRIPAEDWADFEKAVTVMDSERSATVRAFIDWYLQKPGARMPKRPAREGWDRQ